MVARGLFSGYQHNRPVPVPLTVLAGGIFVSSRSRYKCTATIAAFFLIVVGMDLPIPDFGDVVGLRRLYRAAVERIRRMDMPEADKRVWIAELARQYRAARVAAN